MTASSNHMVDLYDCRRRLNQASRAWATRDRQPWTEDEDSFLIEFWIDVDPRTRDEVSVSQCLERTIEACRVRCEHIRRVMGWTTRTVVRVTTTVEVCPTHFVALPVTGECDYC